MKTKEFNPIKNIPLSNEGSHNDDLQKVEGALNELHELRNEMVAENEKNEDEILRIEAINTMVDSARLRSILENNLKTRTSIKELLTRIDSDINEAGQSANELKEVLQKGTDLLKKFRGTKQ